MTHFDLAGNELKDGSPVAVLGKQYRFLIVGTIVKLTPKTVRVRYPLHCGKIQESNLSPNQMMLIVKEKT